MSDLKPCPFCGGEAYRYHHPFDKGYRFIECECGAETGLYPTIEEAEEAWNTRHSEQWIPVSENGETVISLDNDDLHLLRYALDYLAFNQQGLGISVGAQKLLERMPQPPTAEED